MRIGVISDTHGLLYTRAEELLNGVEHIIHAGDIGKEQIIRRLEAIAPVSAVTGNVDWGNPLNRLFPRTLTLALGGCAIYVIHIGGKPAEFRRALPSPRPRVAICGHSHIPLLAEHEGVLFINPGSASTRRFGDGMSLAILTIEAGQPSAKILPVEE
jgi:putative phosphoesterase